jgi:hypothetical protein
MARVKKAAAKPAGSDKKAKAPKLPVKKTVEKQVADLEAAAAERKQVQQACSRGGCFTSIPHLLQSWSVLP